MTFAVESKGIGRPDYSNEVAAGQIRPGLSLKTNQVLLYFIYAPQDLVAVPYAIPWIQGLLAPGGAASLIDSDTGIATPYTLARGYVADVVEAYWTFNQDAELWFYMDGLLIACIASVSSGSYGNIGPIVGFTTRVFDPTGATAHIVDLVLINRGAGNLRGEASFTVLLEAVGTPPFPTEKDCRCPFCKIINRVDIKTSKIKCRNCGKDFVVMVHRPGGFKK